MPDALSLLDTKRFARLPAPKHLSDLYLLALAVKHGGRLITFDARIDPNLTPGGAKALVILPHA